MPLPTTEIFAFSQPKIKAGEISVAVNLGASQLHVLHASRSVWRGLWQHLDAEFAGRPTPAPRAVTPEGPRLQGAQRQEIYGAIWQQVQAGANRRAACQAAGVSYLGFQSWRAQQRAALRAAPILKPGGKLL